MGDNLVHKYALQVTKLLSPENRDARFSIFSIPQNYGNFSAYHL